MSFCYLPPDILRLLFYLSEDNPCKNGVHVLCLVNRRCSELYNENYFKMYLKTKHPLVDISKSGQDWKKLYMSTKRNKPLVIKLVHDINKLPNYPFLLDDQNNMYIHITTLEAHVFLDNNVLYMNCFNKNLVCYHKQTSKGIIVRNISAESNCGRIVFIVCHHHHRQNNIEKIYNCHQHKYGEKACNIYNYGPVSFAYVLKHC
jgi:hypothetical protein